MIYNDSDTIVAPATATGGALCLIRISGEQAIAIVDDIFRGKQPLSLVGSHRAVYGNIVENGQVVDDVVVTIFKAPNIYTGEDVVELKRLLIDHGFGKGITVDKVSSKRFGSNTKKRVKEYQKSAGLKVDGVAGHDTIITLGGIWCG